MARNGMALAALAALCAACASPIKPAVVDASGPKVRQAAVTIRFQNNGGNPRITPGVFPAEFQSAMEREASRASDGAVTIARTPQPVGHVIAVEATLLSRTTHTSGYYDSCAYRGKNNTCVGGMVGESTNYSRLRMQVRVTEAKGGKVVYQSDDQSSKPVSVDDRGIDTLARDTARAVMKALKESGVI